MTMSSINIFCNSVESPLRFSLKVFAIFVSNSFLCLGVKLCFNESPPDFMHRNTLWVFN